MLRAYDLSLAVHLEAGILSLIGEQVMESRLVLWRNSQYASQLKGGRDRGRRGAGREGGRGGREEREGRERRTGGREGRGQEGGREERD